MEDEDSLKAFIASAAGVDERQVSLIVSATLGGKPLTKEAVKEAKMAKLGSTGSVTGRMRLWFRKKARQRRFRP